MTLSNLLAAAITALMIAVPLFYATTSHGEGEVYGSDRFQYGVVYADDLSDWNREKLLRDGWIGLAGDGVDALYSPAPLHPDHFENLAESVRSECLLAGHFHLDDLSCTPHLS